MVQFYVDEALQKSSSSDERGSNFQSSINVEFPPFAAGSRVDVPHLESHLSCVGVRSRVGSIRLRSNAWLL